MFLKVKIPIRVLRGINNDRDEISQLLKDNPNVLHDAFKASSTCLVHIL